MNKTLGIFLIIAVTLVLLALVFIGQVTLYGTLTILIVLVVLILVIGGASELLPSVLKTILSGLERILRL